MPRRTRIQTPGLIRHVMARGNGRMEIFLDDHHYAYFMYLLGDVVERFDLECLNYCAMPNHYHLTIKPNHPNLSEAMGRLGSRYAMWWNRQHRHVGHVYQGRFKDQIVQEDGYLRTLSRYVVLNPVRAGLVQRPEDWRWSSYAATVGLRPSPSFVSIDSTLEQFGDGDQETLRARFREYVLGAQEECNDIRIRSNERIVGDRAFKKSVLASVRRSSRSDCVSNGGLSDASGPDPGLTPA